MRKFALAIAAVASILAAPAAFAADITWQNNPNWFPGVMQAFQYNSPVHSKSAAALKLACPKGLNEQINKSRTCGQANIKFLASCGGGRKVRMQGTVLYIGIPVCNDLDKVKSLM